MKKSLILVAALLMAPGLAQENPLTLTISADQKEYTINDWIQVETKLENTTDKAVEVNELLFDEDSLSFDIEVELKKYTYAVLSPDRHVRDKLPLTRVTIGPKKSVTGIFKIPTVKTGKMLITGSFNGPEKQKTTSNKIEVMVKPTAAQEHRLGAIVDIVVDDNQKEKKSLMFELFPDYAPVGVSCFIALVKKNFYKDLKFFRLEKSNWIQAGCPYNLGIGGAGFSFKNEAPDQSIHHDLGTLSLSGFKKFGYCSSQFYVCLAKLSFLDKRYPVIGKANKEALEYIEKEFAKLDVKGPDSIEPQKKIVIDSIKIVTIK
jgi:peptidyl-prolyl cis-trans isomerase B (cyclophilin B)